MCEEEKLFMFKQYGKERHVISRNLPEFGFTFSEKLVYRKKLVNIYFKMKYLYNQDM